ncbi:MAG: GAF domain-containing protein [Bacillota bacterium]
MKDALIKISKDRKENYKLLKRTIPTFITARDPWYTSLSNISALLAVYMDDINWVGFYLNDGEKLCLGPFQGKPACTEIPFTKGVCGEAARDKKVMVVDDVLKRDDHIACDADSRSELVVPLVKHGKLLGVLDIDSPSFNRFGDDEVTIAKEVARVIVDNWR